MAIRHYESAATDGHIESMNALGNLFFTDLKDYEQAAVWFKKASDKGCTVALNNLGICFE
jgi:TPR repeat protein